MDGGVAPWAIEVERFAQARAPELGSLFAALQGSGKPSSGLASSVEIPSHARRRTTSHKRYKRRFWAQGKSKHSNARANANANDKAPKECEPEGVDKRKKRELKVSSLSRRVRRRIEFQSVVRGNGGTCKDGTRRLVTHVWHAKRFYMSKRWGYWLANGIPGRGHCAKTVLRWSAHGAVLHDSSYYSAILLEGPQVELSQVLSLVVEPLSDGNDSPVPCYINGMAHHCGKVPLSCIAPVKIIFCPESTAPPNEQNRLCIFVHAAAFNEVFESLQAASQSCPNTSCSKKGELATLEVIGKGTFRLLGKVLKDSSVTSFIQKLDELPNQAFVALEVYDPRDTSIADAKSVLPNNSGHSDDIDIGVEQPKNTLSVSYKPAYWQALMGQLANLKQRHSASLLWAPSTTIEPPASDMHVKRRLHRTRASHFRLDVDNGGELSCLKKCPILIMKHDLKTLSGCSIVLPVSWVHVIWMSLVLGGAHVIGQRERRWVMTHEGFASFPFDFPDCPAYRLLDDEKQNDVQTPTATLVLEHSKVEDFSGFVARSKLLLSTYLQHHGLRLEQYKPMASTEWNMCGLPGPCLIRIMIQSARKGVPEEGCIIYAPSVQDFHAWLDRAQKWQGVENTNQVCAVRSKIGFVTSAGPWRSGDAAMGMCDVSELCKLQCWQAAESCESLIKNSKFLVLFQNPRSSKIRPALGFVSPDVQE